MKKSTETAISMLFHLHVNKVDAVNGRQTFYYFLNVQCRYTQMTSTSHIPRFIVDIFFVYVKSGLFVCMKKLHIEESFLLNKLNKRGDWTQ